MSRPVDPRKQFSKKLAARSEFFWFFFLVLLVALAYARPESITAVIALASLVTAEMITSVLAYTHNSEYEKGLYAANQMAKIKFNFKDPSGKTDSGDGKEDDEKANVEDGEGEG